MTVIDLSHPIRDGMQTYPGLPGPEIGEFRSFEESRTHYDEGTEFLIGRFAMVTSTATYLDSPRHRFRDGDDVGGIALDRCADLPAVVVDVYGVEEIGAEEIPADIYGAAVLFHTGWDRHWGTETYGAHTHPHFTPAAAERLVAGGALLVGIDSINVDATTTRARPVHTTLLAHGVLVVENLTNLGGVAARGARFTAAPLAVEELPSFPVRAFVVLPDPAADEEERH